MVVPGMLQQSMTNGDTCQMHQMLQHISHTGKCVSEKHSYIAAPDKAAVAFLVR